MFTVIYRLTPTMSSDNDGRQYRPMCRVLKCLLRCGYTLIEIGLRFFVEQGGRRSRCLKNVLKSLYNKTSKLLS